MAFSLPIIPSASAALPRTSVVFVFARAVMSDLMAFSPPIIPSASRCSPSNVTVFVFCKGCNERFDRLLSPILPSATVALPRTPPSSSLCRAVMSGLIAFSPGSYPSERFPALTRTMPFFFCKGCNERFDSLLSLSFQALSLHSLERFLLFLSSNSFINKSM